MATMSAKVRLKKAAQIIRDKGWTQGTMRDYDGRVCLLGAWEEAGDGNDALKLLAARVFRKAQILAVLEGCLSKRAESCLKAILKANKGV